jgi:hypothetical protein
MKKPPPDELGRLPQARRLRTRMARALMALGALGLLAFYLSRPPTLRDPGAEYRPTGTMSWVKNTKEPDYDAITVERKLAEIGAHAAGGKLYDADGRELRFFRRYGGGAQPPPQMIEAEQKELRRLKSLYTDIELAPFDPRHPPL